MIAFREVSAYYGKKKVLENISLEVNEPAIVAVIGPNGSGKTTFLKTFLNLVRYEGIIEINGYSPNRHQREIRKIVGYMPQRETTSEEIPLRVKDVLLMTLYSHYSLLRSRRKEFIERCRKILSLLNLEDLWNANFSKLSEGQKQRILFARTILLEPKILLLDEPFNGVDIPSQHQIINIIKELKTKGVISFVVVHDLDTLAPCADYILIINKKMFGFGRPQEVLQEDILEKVYGRKVPVVIHEGVCYPIIGDRHG